MQGYRPKSSLKGLNGGLGNRPMSSINGVGFPADSRVPGSHGKSPFDDLPKEEYSQLPEKVAERLEQELRQCIRDAMVQCEAGNYTVSLARLQEALNVDVKLRKHHFAHGQQQFINPEFQAVVRAHLCKVLALSGNHDAALSNYEKLVATVDRQEAADIRLKMGDLYQRKGQYGSAVKEYRKALDLAPPEYHRLRQKIATQLALASIRLDKWQDAIDTIEENLVQSVALLNSQGQESDRANLHALGTKFDPIFTLLTCYYAMNNQKMMLQTFKRLIETCQIHGDQIDVFAPDSDEHMAMWAQDAGNTQDDELDALSRYNAGLRHEQRTKLLLAARLIAPVIAFSEIQGFEMLAEILREQGHQALAFQVQMSKALCYLERNQFEEATKSLLDVDRQGLEAALALGINVPAQVLQRSRDVSLAVAAAADRAAEGPGVAGPSGGGGGAASGAAPGGLGALEALERERLLSAKAVPHEDAGRAPYATFIPRGVHTNIAFIQYLKGDYEAALSHAQTAQLTDPFDAYARVNLGCALHALGRVDLALREFEEAQQTSPDCLQAVYNAGLARYRRGEHEAAYVQFQRVLARLPRCADALFLAADCLARLGRAEEAQAAALRLASLYGPRVQDPGLLARLGELHQALGEEAAGAHYFKEAARLAPYNLDYVRWLGAYFVRQELFEQARLCFERGARADRSNPSWALQAAACLAKTNQLKEAAIAYQTALKRFPANQDCLKALIHVLDALGRTEEAVILTRRLEKLQAAPVSGRPNEEQRPAEQIQPPPSSAGREDRDLFGAEDVAALLPDALPGEDQEQ